MTVKMNNGSSLWLKSGLRAAVLAGVAALLVACGGDSDCTAPPAFEGEQVGECDGGGGRRLRRLPPTCRWLSAPPVCSNNGTNQITATVTAVDANRNALPDIPVTVSVNNDAVATVSGPVTDDLGLVTAAVGIGADRANRTITVTATQWQPDPHARLSRWSAPT